MPRTLIMILGMVTLLAWFIIGGRRSAWDKFLSIVIIISIYIAIRWMHGDTVEQMFSYFLK